MLIFLSCSKDDDFEPDSDWSELNNLDKSKYYQIPISEVSDFDEVLYHDGAYIAAKADQERGLYTYFVSKTSIADRQGIFLVMDAECNVYCFGHPDHIVVPCMDTDGNVAIMSTDDLTDAIDLTVLNTTSEKNLKAPVSRAKEGYDPWSWVKLGLGEIPLLGQLISAYDFGKAWQDRDTFSMTLNLFCTGISYTPLAAPIGFGLNVSANEWEQECNRLKYILYGNAKPEIKEVINVGGTKHEVVVQISGASELTKPYTVNVTDNFGCRQLSVDRKTYLYVDCNLVPNAELDPTYAQSYGIAIENPGNDEPLTISVPIDIPEGQTLYLRPHLDSDTRLDNDKIFRLFNKHLLYGPDYTYGYADITLAWRQVDAIGHSKYENDNSRKRNITFQIEVRAKKASKDYKDLSITDWGFVIINEEGDFVDRFSFVEYNEDYDPYEQEVSRTIDYTLDERYLYVDDYDYVAETQGWQICPYSKISLSNEWIPREEEVYGKPMEFQLRYSAAPSIKYVDCEYFGTYIYDGTVWGYGQPFLINYDEKIYADVVSNFDTTLEYQGSFFLDRAYYRKGEAWSKYCSAFFDDWVTQEFTDGQNSGIKSFAWNRSEYECNNTLSHYIEYHTTQSVAGISNKVLLVPIKKKDDKGNTYYFGYKPVIEN